MLVLELFLSVTGPIATDLIELAAQRRAVTGVARKNCAQLSIGRSYEQRRQIVIDRPSLGAPVGRETCLTLPVA